MPWNMKDFPASMKNLDKLTRKKAIDIANALLDEGTLIAVRSQLPLIKQKNGMKMLVNQKNEPSKKKKIQARRMNTIRILVPENCLIQM